ncbi:tyrosine-protein phosphatase [Neobacillus mesonae]|uniref:tyrosine-protein phosphatase n=1 Tax=Neobacillus mesonae TaxID=1193713 RepID=UPI0008338B84|nr:CpsB/CapC family capsule biosynthesis tyrosine phosphatase [Neobacillus mesonae]
MIDVHCHILPGLDDGAQDVSDSIRMAKQAVEHGIDTIVATPHHLNNQYKNPKQVILNKVDELNQILQSEKIDLKIVPGQEVRIHGEMVEGFQKGEIQPVNGSKYVLVEFSSAHVPRYADRLFYDLQVNGLIPIIVHPERNQEIIEKPDLLYQFVKKGALSQVTAASLTGDFGKKIMQFSLNLVEANLAHMVASDAHNTTNRGFKMRDAFSVIQAKYGNEMMFVLQENAAHIVEGLHVYKEVPERIKKKKFFKIF